MTSWTGTVSVLDGLFLFMFCDSNRQKSSVRVYRNTLVVFESLTGFSKGPRYLSLTTRRNLVPLCRN